MGVDTSHVVFDENAILVDSFCWYLENCEDLEIGTRHQMAVVQK